MSTISHGRFRKLYSWFGGIWWKSYIKYLLTCMQCYRCYGRYFKCLISRKIAFRVLVFFLRGNPAITQKSWHVGGFSETDDQILQRVKCGKQHTSVTCIALEIKGWCETYFPLKYSVSHTVTKIQLCLSQWISCKSTWLFNKSSYMNRTSWSFLDRLSCCSLSYFDIQVTDVFGWFWLEIWANSTNRY